MRIPKNLMVVSPVPEAAAHRAVTPLMLTAATAALIGAPTLALATPTGPYRLAFITDENYAATSSDIATYNSDVTAAAGDNAALPSTMWYAIASVPGTSAFSNITGCAGCSSAVPIYLVDGVTLVGTSVSDMFAATEAAISEDQFGNENDAGGNGLYVWTGSNADGSADLGAELGSAATTAQLGLNSPASLEFDLPGFQFTDTNALPLYAISGVIDAPEPASLSILGISGIALAAARRRRRRQQAGQ